ncbi:hypothetical protein [Salinimonas iocasae]|uniref:hypothetical protein n=1 Tax=Salinimonas iocasae TaxID=2572577 RepID=UPI001E44FA9D|nr:hypothetical protein [Salinimonas iocasae]
MRKLLVTVILAAVSSSLFAHSDKTQKHPPTLSGNETAPGQVVLSFHEALREQNEIAAFKECHDC